MIKTKRGTCKPDLKSKNMIANSICSNSLTGLLIKNRNIAKSTRSQLQISFGMIFSVILIIAFIAIAIYAVVKFLQLKECALIGMFKDEFKNEVEAAWKSSERSNNFERELPSKIKEVCFIDFRKAAKGNVSLYNKIKNYGNTKINMFFLPYKRVCGELSSFTIEHLNIEKITENKNPYCVKSNGKIKLKIEKGFSEKLVRVK